MKTRNAQLGFLCLAGMTAVSLLPGTATAQPTYRVTDLGGEEAFGLNNQRQVVGNGVHGENHAFVWLPEADLGLPAGIHDLGVRRATGRSV